MQVLVTGGAGYIGSVVNEELVKSGHRVVVYDSLYKGDAEAVAAGIPLIKSDLADASTLIQTLKDYEIQAVVHMAADALVGESMQNPGKYYKNNVINGITLLECMKVCKVKTIVFSSSAAVYGECGNEPIKETHPLHPSNPYGETKLAFERALHWYSTAHGFHYASLRYFNAAGASANSGEWHDPESHLIPLILHTALGRRDSIEIYGNDYPTRDGTCVRDYIHVMDLAAAHVLALEALGSKDAQGLIYNLGCGGDGYTVQEVVDTIRKITERQIQVRMSPRRPGDPAMLVASSNKIRQELGWRPQFQNLDAIVDSAWAWLKAHSNGYAR
jgi:UDP-glucose 4-epimerase